MNILITLIKYSYDNNGLHFMPIGNENKVKHLLKLPNASTHLSLWKADLDEEGSFDDAIQGCQGVFHVASPMEFISSTYPEVQSAPIVTSVQK